MSAPILELIPEPQERPVLVAEDLVRIFDYGSRSAAYRAMRSGDLPVVRIGNRLYVPTAALRQLLGMPA
ncbi:MAG: DNA-binding protein [Actinobacteria bacterium]|nr:MAG: DNA-binding protein [Actinomycetota bacterium]